MVTLEAPVLVIVSESELCLPIVTLPKLRLVGFALSAPAVIPVPDTAIANDGLDPLEVMVTVPVAPPLDFGAKVSVNVVLWDAPRLTGVEMPLIENEALSTEICEIETLEESPLVIVTSCDLVAPTTTLPKASLEGLSASCPAPVPERATIWVPLAASLPTDSVALKAAVAFGVNETFNTVLCPAASATGSVGDASAKYFVETEALLMLSVLFPEFVAVSVRLLVAFGLTLPKSRLALPKTRFPLCWVCWPLLDRDSLSP